jgi:beta-glucosidase
MHSYPYCHSGAALAISLNLTSSGAVYAAAGRILAQRLRTGQFDPLETTPGELLAFGAEDIGSAANAASAAEAMAQGLVLLRNNASVLPLKAGTGRIAVLGPTGNLSSAQVRVLVLNG